MKFKLSYWLRVIPYPYRKSTMFGIVKLEHRILYMESSVCRQGTDGLPKKMSPTNVLTFHFAFLHIKHILCSFQKVVGGAYTIKGFKFTAHLAEMNLNIASTPGVHLLYKFSFVHRNKKSRRSATILSKLPAD